jgi:hypothetical protein
LEGLLLSVAMETPLIRGVTVGDDIAPIRVDNVPIGVLVSGCGVATVTGVPVSGGEDTEATGVSVMGVPVCRGGKGTEITGALVCGSEGTVVT